MPSPATTDRAHRNPEGGTVLSPQAADHAPEDAAPRVRRRRILVFLVAVLAAGLLAANHRQVTALRDRFVPKRWGVVEEGKIYRSGQISRHLIRQMLESNGIQVVVDLTWDDPNEPNHLAEVAAIADLGIDRRLCPLLSDGTGDVHIYARAVSEVAAAAREGKTVLVHCAAGAQRTGGVVALFRMLVQRKSPEFALAEMRRYKYDPQRSPRLLEFVNAHIGEIAEDLVRDGTLDRVPDPLPQLRAE